MAVQHLKTAEFDEVVKAAPLAMVDFWADWCGPCKMLTPTVEALAEQYGDRVVTGKVNVDEEPELACFQGAVQEALIRQFRDMTENFRQLTIQELAAKLSSSIPVPGIQSADSSELGILQKAIRSKGRMLSIRKLFERAPTLLRRLCPCTVSYTHLTLPTIA